MTDRPLRERVHEVAALDHPLTQAAYQLLRGDNEVSRDLAAEAMGVARSVAAFHLDKLVDARLAEVRFARLSGRSGPGAGRTAKLYRRAEAEVGVSLPERRYDLAGELLAQAAERATRDDVPVDRALRDAATAAGRQIGASAASESGGRSRRTRRDAIVRSLEDRGYEPEIRDGEIVLRNCPFHVLAEQHRDLVCGMNLDLLSGVVEGADQQDGLEARLAPEPGYCCVRLKAA